MKLVLTEALKTRLKNTAFNGSRIAKDILTEVNKNSEVTEVIKGKYNFFRAKIHRRIIDNEREFHELTITCCNKDLNNPSFPDYGNPNAPWKSKNRTEIKASTFLGLFKNLPSYSDEEVQFFESAIVINEKIFIRKMDKELGFQLAYSMEHYTSSIQRNESTLWNSCMRGNPYADIAADFYGNLCKAKVIIAQDSEGKTYGRCILWEGLETHEHGIVSLIDRIYFSHDFIFKMIQNYARNSGVTFRKASNTYDSQTKLINMNHPDLPKDGSVIRMAVYKELKLSKWYKQGVPYVDTLDKLIIRNKKVYITNSDNVPCVMELKTTHGSTSGYSDICPVCGESIAKDSHKVCESCRSKYTVDTEFGPLWEKDLVSYKNELIPSLCFKDKKPRRGLRNWTIVKMIQTPIND